MLIYILIAVLLACIVRQAGGFRTPTERARHRRAMNRNHRNLELLRERGRAWAAWDTERSQNPRSRLLPKLRSAYLRARRDHERFPVDWTPATL